MCIKLSWKTTVDSCLPLRCCIQEWVGVQWHSQVGRCLATIHISCILLLCCTCILKPHWKLCSAKCILYIIGAVSLSWMGAYVDTANIAHLPHTTTPSKHHSYLSPPPKKQQKQVTKKNILTKWKNILGWNPEKATKQGRNDTTIPLRIIIPISFAIFPTSHTHTNPWHATPAISTANRMWQLQHFTMQHTSPPHTTTYPPHAAIHTLAYIHVPLTPHSTPQSTPTMTPTLFHLQQHSFTSPTVSTEHISKLYYTKARADKKSTLFICPWPKYFLKNPDHPHHNLTSCCPMYVTSTYVWWDLVAKLAKDIGMTIRIVVSFLPCLVAFWGFHPYMFFRFLKCFFGTCLC